MAHFHRTHAHYRIDVADNRLLLSLNLGGVRLSRRSLPLDEIEQVWIKPVRLGVVERADRTVVIETDRRTASLSLLSPAAGAWVAGHIRRIAAAPPGAALRRGGRGAPPPPGNCRVSSDVLEPRGDLAQALANWSKRRRGWTQPNP